jgi:hypothetical protein
MIEIGDTGNAPIQIWENWPHGHLRKGDILRVSWWYEGVHGPVSSEKHHLLLECPKVDEDEEVWDCMIFDETTNGEKRPTEFRQHTIYSSDFRVMADSADWQRIALIVRAEQ